MEIMLIKAPQGFLYPESNEVAEKIARMKAGAMIRCEITQVRNPQFHRKFMALLRVGYDAFELPTTEYRGYACQKDFEQFREDVTIAAGYYTTTFSLSGTFRVRAKSIRFGRMSQENFERLYSQVANVLLEKVLRHYANRAALDNAVNQILGFV